MRIYTPDDRANAVAAVVANGGNVTRTARDLALPAQTLRQWVTGERCEEARADAAAKIPALAECLQGIVESIIESIDTQLILETKLQGRMVAMGIAVEKMLLLRGQPTAISEQREDGELISSMTDEELEQMERIHSAARARMRQGCEV